MHNAAVLSAVLVPPRKGMRVVHAGGDLDREVERGHEVA
jgi:hypothetical protein